MKRDLDDHDKVILKRVEEVAEKRGWTMSQVPLAWFSKRIASPVLGLSSPERMDGALAIRGQSLSEAEEQYLEEAYKPRAVVGHG